MSEFRIAVFNPVTGDIIYHFLIDESIQQYAKDNMHRHLKSKKELTKFPTDGEYVAKLQKKIFSAWKDVRVESLLFHIENGVVVIR